MLCSRIFILYMAELYQLFNNKKYKVFNKDLSHPLGEGMYGTVFMAYYAEDHPKDPKMVLKRIRKSKLPQQYQYLLYEEVKAMETLRKADAKHVLYSIDHFEDDIYMYHILPLCDGRDLEKYIDDKTFLSESEARDLISQIVDGVFYLHSNGIIHRDLKPANVFLNTKNGKPECIVADFGFAKQSDLFQTRLGSPITMAPEILRITSGDHYDHKADIYSIGAIFHKMLFGKFPYETQQGLDNIGKYPLKIEKSYCLSESCLSFLECCLQMNPTSRPSIVELKRHPFIRDPVPYYLKKGLMLEKGSTSISHTKKDYTSKIESKSKGMSQLLLSDAKLEHWSKVCSPENAAEAK